MSKDSDNSFNNKGPNSPEEDECNGSFVRKVKSRVSGLIPSSLSKWFGSDGTKKAVVRLREEDEDEQQPPVKRAKLPPSSSSLNNSYTATPGIFLPPRSGPLRSLFLRDDNIPGPSPTPIGNHEFYNGDDKDSESGESTSGYSSIVKVTAPSDDKKDAYDITNVINANQLFSSSNLGNNRSLFTDRSISSHGNTSLSSRRPSFNASTFGSPTFVDRTLSTQRIMSSPFYNGCTMYGGAAAHNKPKTPKVQVKPINETVQNVNHSATLSKTARRILDTLEQYATDVNRIPHPLSDKKQQQPLLTKYSGANPYIIREHRVPNAELQVPTVPDLLKMKLKERLQDSTVAMRHIAATSKSARDEYKSSKHANKIKTKISSVRQKPEDEAMPKTSLPEIALPITTLPKFDLSFPLPSSNITKPVTVACTEPPKKVEIFKPTEVIKPVEVVKPPETPLPLLTKLKTPVKVVSETSSPKELLDFKFADPLVLAENLKSIIAINDFKFSEPVIFNKLKACDAFNKIKNNTANKLPGDDLAKFKPSSDTWECSVCLLRNLSDKIVCAACEAPKGVNEVRTKQSLGFDDKWKCTNCSVLNISKDSACIKCKASIQKLNGPITATFGGKFKPPSATWECLTCMIRNKDELDKCAACETPKVGATVTRTPQKPLDIFKMKSDQWECSVCMVRNPLEKTKCLACETPKSNTNQVNDVKTAPSFTFGIFPNSKTTISGFITTEPKQPTPPFSFGVKNADAPDGLSKVPSFVFGNAPVVTPQTSSPFMFGTKPVTDKVEQSKRPSDTKSTTPGDTKSTTPVVFKPPDITHSEPPKTTPNKYFVSNSSAFTLPKTTESSTFKFTAPVTATSVIVSQTPAPSLFTTPTTAPSEIQAKFETSTKPIFETATSTPAAVSKPLFEMAVQQKPAFESPAFNATPAFTFGSTPAKPSGFSFGQQTTETEKVAAPMFGFGTQPGGFSFTTAQTVPSSTPAFSFNTMKPVQSVFQSSTQPAKNIFGSETEATAPTQTAPLQNGLFSFGETAKGGFSFGAPSQPFNAPTVSSTPGIFSFGASQPASTTSSGFSFGTTSTPTFNADIKPSFNFTGGATPTFSAQQTGESLAVQQRRKIRAVRRNPQR